MTFIPLPEEDKWGEKTIISQDKETIELLKDIIVELKKMNTYFSLITETELPKEDY